MPAQRAATAADAKAVWDSIAKAGRKPQVRAVADAMRASGKFKNPPSYGTIQRWKRRGWTEPGPKANVKRGKLEVAITKLDAAVPVLTGNPNTRLEDLAGRPQFTLIGPDGKAIDPQGALPADPIDAAIVLHMRQLPMAELAEFVAKSVLMSIGVTAQRLLRSANLVDQQPRDVGSLQAALAGSMSSANEGLLSSLEVAKRYLDVVPNEGAPAGADDELKTAFEAWEKAEKDGGADD